MPACRPSANRSEELSITRLIALTGSTLALLSKLTVANAMRHPARPDRSTRGREWADRPAHVGQPSHRRQRRCEARADRRRCHAPEDTCSTIWSVSPACARKSHASRSIARCDSVPGIALLLEYAEPSFIDAPSATTSTTSHDPPARHG